MFKKILLPLAVVLCLTACQSYEEPTQYPDSDKVSIAKSHSTEQVLKETLEGETLIVYVAQDKWKYKNEQNLYASPYGFYVRYEEKGYWENTRVPILNFSYERGYEYKLEVSLEYMSVNGGAEEPVYVYKDTISVIKRK